MNEIAKLYKGVQDGSPANWLKKEADRSEKNGKKLVVIKIYPIKIMRELIQKEHLFKLPIFKNKKIKKLSCTFSCEIANFHKFWDQVFFLED